VVEARHAPDDDDVHEICKRAVEWFMINTTAYILKIGCGNRSLVSNELAVILVVVFGIAGIRCHIQVK